MKFKLPIGHHIIAVLFFCVALTSHGYAQCDTTEYTTKQGENLARIANEFKNQYSSIDPKYQITADSIKKWNNFNDSETNKIYPGDVLKIKIPCENNDQSQATSASKQKDEPNTTTGSTSLSGQSDVEKPNPNESPEKQRISLWWLWLLLGGIAGVFCWEKLLSRKNPRSSSDKHDHGLHP